MPHIDEKELARNLAAKAKRKEAAQKKQAAVADAAREIAQKSLDKAGEVDVKAERQLALDRVKLLDDGSTGYEIKEDTTFQEVAAKLEHPSYRDLANFNGVWNEVFSLRKGQYIVIPPVYVPKLDSTSTEKA
jgi:polyribonucleotide nucleotidyltransferase